MGDSYPNLKSRPSRRRRFLGPGKKPREGLRLIRSAGKEGAKVIGFPECFIPQAFRMVRLPPRQGMQISIAELFKNSVEIPGKRDQRSLPGRKGCRGYGGDGFSTSATRRMARSTIPNCSSARTGEFSAAESWCPPGPSAWSTPEGMQQFESLSHRQRSQ